MTGKERLEEAKLMAKMLRVETRLPYDFPFDLVDWLVEQAERVQELETTVDFYQSALRDADRRVQELENHIDHLYDNNVHLKGDYRLQEQNKRYREALKFYAEGKHVAYKLDETDDDLVVDYGETARKALEGEK